MKPKNLKCPFTWEQRKPVLQNKVLYVPEYYDKHAEWEMPAFDHHDFFGNSNEVFIEYCSGNGLWIAEQAQKNPHINWIAVEHDFERVRRVWAKINNYNLSNLIVVSGEALMFTRYYLADCSISRMYMNFPDPWPKRKHAKNRLVQRPFVEEITRILKEGAQAIFVTDDEVYMQQISSEIRAHPLWKPSYPEPFFITDWPEYGNSSFDVLWRKKGKTIHYLQFEKKS
ncbi:MAG: tRNA (guanosine(46)-N7)-methyltransferase TrmB [Chlamydiota bacterium]